MHHRINALAIDTSTTHAAIGVQIRSGLLCVDLTDGSQKHGRDLVPTLSTLLEKSGIQAREIELIGVGLGPGSYTGLRVGVMAAKTVAYATGATLVGLDSLEAVAWNAPASATRISVVADAQRGDVYSAEFVRKAPNEPLECVRESQIEPLATWSSRLETGTLVLGPGLNSNTIRLQVPPELFAANPMMNYPDARNLLKILDREWQAGRRENVWLVEPRYLRRSAAEEKWDSLKGDGMSSPTT